VLLLGSEKIMTELPPLPSVTPQDFKWNSLGLPTTDPRFLPPKVKPQKVEEITEKIESGDIIE
jgi:hypothetical protein